MLLNRVNIFSMNFSKIYLAITSYWYTLKAHLKKLPLKIFILENY